jgi:DNA-binding response OmpR family regulator
MREPRPLEGKRILLAEDDHEVGDYLRKTLEQAGGAVSGPARSLSHCNELLDTEGFDGAVLDIRLTDGSAINIVDRLRLQTIPFILITGYPGQALPQKVLAAPLLAKPAAYKSLVSVAAKYF